MKITMLGTRGSVPVHGRSYEKYGGATSCVLVQAAGQDVLLDAGTGLLEYRPAPGTQAHILMSHMHIDHALGLPMFRPLFRGEINATVYARTRGGLDTRAQLGRLMSPPLWPVGPDIFGDRLLFSALDGDALFLGDVRVMVTEGNHPGGAVILRLESGGKSAVYCTDFEHGEGHTERLIRFAEGCDVLIYDANYSAAEYPRFVGWGHSTWDMGAEIGRKCGASRIVMFHHSSSRSDAALSKIEDEFVKTNPNCVFGKAGEVLEL